MATKIVDLWFYLGRRDKRGVRIIAKLRGREQMPVRVEDVSALQLPPVWQAEITQIVYDSRMEWEPWVESASTFDELRASLKLRGYTKIPVTSHPEFATSNVQTPQINNSYLPQKKTMVRKRLR